MVRATVEREVKGKGKSMEEGLRKARQVYFVMQSFVYVNWDLHGKAVSILSLSFFLLLPSRWSSFSH